MFACTQRNSAIALVGLVFLCSSAVLYVKLLERSKSTPPTTLVHIEEPKQTSAPIQKTNIILNAGPLMWGFKRGIPRTAESLVDQMYGHNFPVTNLDVGGGSIKTEKPWNKLPQLQLGQECKFNPNDPNFNN